MSTKRVMGIEPTYLAWKASVLPLNYTRIFPNMLYIYVNALDRNGPLRNAQSRNRTSDTRIFSPLLYQLSYLGLSIPYHNSIILPTRQKNVNTFFVFFSISHPLPCNTAKANVPRDCSLSFRPIRRLTLAWCPSDCQTLLSPLPYPPTPFR